MIEVIYKEEKQEAKNGENLFNLPRNIRQVGLTTGNMRIYIEDYVYTFLTRLARNAVGSRKEQGCVAVFTGETKWNNGIIAPPRIGNSIAININIGLILYPPTLH